MTLRTITIVVDGTSIDLTAEQVSEHFVITPTLARRDDNTTGLAGHGQTLRHLGTGIRIVTDGLHDLRRCAEEIEKLPIDWAAFDARANSLTTEQKGLLKATIRTVLYEGSPQHWPWPEWAGDESQPALSLLGKQLDESLVDPRNDKVRELEARAQQLDPEFATALDLQLRWMSAGLAVDGFGLIYLLAVLHRVDPESADTAARWLVDAWQDGGLLGELNYQWREELHQEQPLTLHGFPAVLPA